MNRPFTVVDVPQRSEAWFQARLGRLTGSRAADVLASVTRGEAAARRDLRLQLVCERLTGTLQEEPFINGAMQRGIDLEPQARAAYEAQTGHVVQETGFLAHREFAVGCSLDGYIDDFEGIVELKCPKSATHLRYLRAGTLPPEYRPQITHNLWVTGAAWCDFLSFDDRFVGSLQTFLVRVEAASLDLAAYERAALAFLVEVDREVAALRTMTDLPAVLAAAAHA